MMYLLDTKVISELRRGGHGMADQAVYLWASREVMNQQYVSAITIEELEIGVLRIERRDLIQGRLLRTWLEDVVNVAFEGRILPVDLAVVQQSARLRVSNPRPIRDGFIAATALVHGMPVVTRNVADFESMGVPLLNPWQT